MDKLTNFEKVNVFANNFGIYTFDQLPKDKQKKLKDLFLIKLDQRIKDMGLTFNYNDPNKHTLESYKIDRFNNELKSKLYANIQGTYFELTKI